MATKPSKYNRKKLKAEFMNSEFETVKVRWEKCPKGAPRVPYNTYVKRKTKGRSEHKKELLVEIEQQATEQAKKDILEKYKITLEELLEMKMTCVKLLKAHLGSAVKLSKMGKGFSVRDVALILDKLKIELGESTVITENRLEESNQDPIRHKLLEIQFQGSIVS